ncbi:MAG: hypothetical protein IPP90_11705 [Gemmatimonadaceae bacterium]|nr:hypothetical protein [Gemmatimonadaceae bacterium]
MPPTPCFGLACLPILSWIAVGVLPSTRPSTWLAPVLPLAGQQSERLDVGSFTLFINGQRAGREQFSMQRVAAADGPTLELRAESAIGDRRAAVRLETDSVGTPFRYSVEERTGATVTLRLGGQRVRGRFATLARGTSGEAAREYLLAPGALVLEDDGVLQYALLVRRGPLAIHDSIIIPVLTPIANRQGTVRLTLLDASDTVVIAGSRRVAQRWQATTSLGEARFIWADAEGRLLRVQIPSRGFNALRDDVPR